MRKLKLQMHITIDGFVATPEGQIDWMSPGMDPDQLEFLKAITESMDTIIMGRKMTDGFTTYWESVVDNQPESPEYPYAKIFVDTPKIIFSKTINSVKGRNTSVENGDLVEAVNQLKAQQGKDIIVYGGAGFVSSLLEHGLIDELNLLVNPTAIGNGLRIFNGRFQYRLTKSAGYTSGVVLNQYVTL